MGLSFEERHRRWIEENGIVAGSRVRVAFAVPSRFGGWMNDWSPDMDDFVGENDHTVVGLLDGVTGVGLAVRAFSTDTVFQFPYTCLEKVADTKPEFPPLTGEDKELVIRVLKETMDQMSTKGK